MKKVILFLVVNVILVNIAFSQGAAINVTGSPADQSAILDLSSTSKGLRIPRVGLTDTSSSLIPIVNPVNSLLVFDTLTGAPGSGVIPGYYYWDAVRTQWIRLATGTSTENGWQLEGNAGTDSVLNFIGTTDDVPLIIKTNNTGRVKIDKTGNVGIGNSSPESTLDVSGSFATGVTSITLSGNGQINTGNSSHIKITTTGATSSAPWLFTLSDGHPGQYLMIELENGYAALQNSGNVKLTGLYASFLTSYSVLYLKWDNSYWVEVTRNAFTGATVTLNYPDYYNGKQVFTYTGATQTFSVPAYASKIFVKMWGGGGGGGQGNGGSGAFISGYLNVTPGSNLTVIVGGCGKTSYAVSVPGGYGGGGACGASTVGSYYTGTGGGRSSIQITAGTDATTAGAGGGSGGYAQPYGGGGGAPNGSDGGSSITGGVGRGGTTTAGGAASSGGTVNSSAGSSFIGSAGATSLSGGGGGGGGYFGGSGGSATANGNLYPCGGGGGGSSHVANLSNVTQIAGNQGSGTGGKAAPNNTDTDYVTGVGVGGAYATNGGNGLVVIYW